MRAAFKHMDLLSQQTWQTLLAEQAGPCLSLFMPVYPMNVKTHDEPLHLRHLLATAENQLAGWNLGAAKTAELLAPVRALAKDDLTFWQEQSEGLAIFLAPDFFRTFRLPITFSEKVVVSRRFWVRPLLPLLAEGGQFFLLALSQNQVHLFRATRFALHEITLPQIPHSLAEATHYDQVEPVRQLHSIASSGAGVGRRAVAFHGHGTASDATTVKDTLHHFLQAVDRGVCTQLAAESAPLLLAGTRALCGIYRKVNRYPYLHAESLDGGPDRASLDSLHQRGWALVEPLFHQPEQQALLQLRQRTGTHDARALHDLAAIVPAALNQRVESLFVTPSSEVWGSFAPEQNTVTFVTSPGPDDEELINLALVHTLRNGGNVYVVAAYELNQSTAAALLRY
jgi:hypothetical protein